MQLKEVRKLTHLLIHLGMSGSIKIIYFHLWFVSKLKSSLVLDSLTVESRKEKSCNILCCRVCPCPGWWCLHTHSGHHPFIGRDTQKWADMKHLPEEIAKERQEIARFVPKKHPLLLILKNWSVHTGTNYELKGSEKHQITKQSEGIEICLGDVWMGLIWSTVKYWGDQIIGVETESWCNPVWDLVHPLLPKSDKCVIWRVAAVWHRGGHQPPKRVLSPNFRGMWSSRHFNSTCPECVIYLWSKVARLQCEICTVCIICTMYIYM